MTRYILHPGEVRSKNDGDIHFIGAARLARLYGVVGCECVEINNERDRRTFMPRPGDVHLYPDFTGEYKLPEIVE